MNLDQIQEDLKRAMLARDEMRVSTLRLLVAEINNWRIEKQTEPKEEDLVAIIRQQTKRRKESALAYRSAGREELALKEEAEEKLLSIFLPQQISGEELEKLAKEAVTETGASGPADMGKVIGAVMGKVKGQADGAQVAQVVKRLLEEESSI